MRQIRLRSGRLLGLNRDLHRCLFFHATALCVCNQQIQTEGERDGGQGYPPRRRYAPNSRYGNSADIVSGRGIYSVHCGGGETSGESDGGAGEWEGARGEVFVLQVSYRFVCGE